MGFRPIPKEKYDFFGPRTLTHAAVVFLLVKKSMCACLLAVPQFCSPGKSVSPEKLLPVGARGAPYGKGRFNNQMRWSVGLRCGEKNISLQQFSRRQQLRARRALSSILKATRSLVVTLIVIRKTKDKAKGLRISCPHFLSSAH